MAQGYSGAEPEVCRGAMRIAEAFGEHRSGTVATIGTFDGVHSGHRALLRWAKREARAHGVPLVAITFDPRPEVFFAGDRALPDICSITERVRRLREAGADEVIVLPFDAETASVPADTFARLLRERLRVRRLCVGADFAVGRDREGDAERLTELDVPVVVVPFRRGPDGQKVSSSALRQARRRALSGSGRHCGDATLTGAVETNTVTYNE